MEKNQAVVAQETVTTEQVQETEKKFAMPRVSGKGVKHFVCDRVLPFAVGIGAAVLGAALLGSKDNSNSNDDYTVE